jgi:hypothetical protein
MYRIIKYDWEKPLWLQIYRDLYPPRWQHRCTEQKDSVYLKDKHKHWEVPNIASRNAKTNIFQEESAGFDATTDRNKEKCIKVLCPFM